MQNSIMYQGKKMKRFIPLYDYEQISESEMLTKSKSFSKLMQKRRSVREFSTKLFSDEIIRNCILAANFAPSGANKQPWHFVIVKNAKIKKEIRIEAEKEEREFYNGKATEE